MTRRLSPRELALYELLKHSPRNRALEWLIILTCMFWCLTFWLIDKIVELRSRSRPAPGVGSKRGGPDDEGAIAEPKPSVGGHEFSPPRRDRPNACPHIIGLAERGREQ